MKILKSILVFLFLISLASPVKASNDNKYDKFVDSFKILNEFEHRENVDIIKNLKDMIKDFENALKDETLEDFQIVQYNDQIKYLKDNITTIKNLKSLYSEFGDYNKVKQHLNSNKNDNNDIIISMLPGADAVVCGGYQLEANVIISYFNLRGYKLSAELLARSFSNTVNQSIYVPNTANTNQIKSTTWFTNNKTKTASGSGEFTSGDLYYSIHYFNYSFRYEWGLKYMTISDLYDYHVSAKAEGLAGLANNMMYGAQYYGCLVPFTTTILLPTN